MRSRHSRHRRTFHQRLFDDSTLLLHASLLPLGGPRLAHPRCDLSPCCPGSVHLRSKWTLSNRVHQARVSSLHTPVQTVSAGRLRINSLALMCSGLRTSFFSRPDSRSACFPVLAFTVHVFVFIVFASLDRAFARHSSTTANPRSSAMLMKSMARFQF